MRTIESGDLVTYAALERGLVKLGFARRELREPPASIFEHHETGATLILEKGRSAEKVQPNTYMSARYTIVVQGIASPEQFAAILTRSERETARRADVLRRRQGAVGQSSRERAITSVRLKAIRLAGRD